MSKLFLVRFLLRKLLDLKFLQLIISLIRALHVSKHWMAELIEFIQSCLTHQIVSSLGSSHFDVLTHHHCSILIHSQVAYNSFMDLSPQIFCSVALFLRASSWARFFVHPSYGYFLMPLMLCLHAPLAWMELCYKSHFIKPCTSQVMGSSPDTMLGAQCTNRTF